MRDKLKRKQTLARHFQKNKSKIYTARLVWRKKNPEKYKIKNRKLYLRTLEYRRRLYKEQLYNHLKWINEIKSKYWCKYCGDSNIDHFDFHHRDSLSKKFNIGNYRYSKNNAKIKFLEEIMKCDIICRYCHVKIHKGQLTRNDEIKSYTLYDYVLINKEV